MSADCSYTQAFRS